MVLGSSLGELATCNWEARLTAGKQLVHIDYYEQELGRCYEADFALHGEIAPVMRQLSAGLAQAGIGLSAERKMLLEQLHFARLEAAADALEMETWIHVLRFVCLGQTRQSKPAFASILASS